MCASQLKLEKKQQQNKNKNNKKTKQKTKNKNKTKTKNIKQKKKKKRKKKVRWKAHFKNNACDVLKQTYFFFLIWPYHFAQERIQLQKKKKKKKLSCHNFFLRACLIDWLILFGKATM